jgi:hypothetical protein
MKFARIKLWFGLVLVGVSLLSLIVGLVQRGFSAASLSSMFLLAVGGAIVIDVGPTARGRVPSASATLRRRIMLVGLGLVGGVSLLARLGAGESDRSATPLPSSAGQSPTFTLAGHRATSDALGLALSFGESWTKDESAEKANTLGMFFMRHPDGAHFGALGGRAGPTEDVLTGMLDGNRAEFGNATDVVWGDTSVAGLKGRTLAFTIRKQDDATRSEWVVVRRGDFFAFFMCVAPASTFSARAKPLCQTILDTVESSR